MIKYLLIVFHSCTLYSTYYSGVHSLKICISHSAYMQSGIKYIDELAACVRSSTERIVEEGGWEKRGKIKLSSSYNFYK